jgi:hypothetical protein
MNQVSLDLGVPENEDYDVLTVKVHRDQAGKWHAEIAGGWWVVIGETRQGAIDSVVKRYQDENSKFFA